MTIMWFLAFPFFISLSLSPLHLSLTSFFISFPYPTCSLYTDNRLLHYILKFSRSHRRWKDGINIWDPQICLVFPCTLCYRPPLVKSSFHSNCIGIRDGLLALLLMKCSLFPPRLRLLPKCKFFFLLYKIVNSSCYCSVKLLIQVPCLTLSFSNRK